MQTSLQRDYPHSTRLGYLILVSVLGFRYNERMEYLRILIRTIRAPWGF